MNLEHLEKADKKATELITYDYNTKKIITFIDSVSEDKSLRLMIHGKEMWGNGDLVFELVGEEIVELLKKKVAEREAYLEKLTADDLIV